MVANYDIITKKWKHKFVSQMKKSDAKVHPDTCFFDIYFIVDNISISYKPIGQYSIGVLHSHDTLGKFVRSKCSAYTRVVLNKGGKLHVTDDYGFNLTKRGSDILLKRCYEAVASKCRNTGREKVKTLIRIVDNFKHMYGNKLKVVFYGKKK